MEFQNVVQSRRSVRQFEADAVPSEVMKTAFMHGTLAPNSSNMQTWDFYWVRSPEAKSKLVQACLSQSAARTASELVVIAADYGSWRRAQKPILDFARSIGAPKQVIEYYQKLMPMVYRSGLLNAFAPFKWLLFNTVGLFRPMMRGPVGSGGLKEVAIKSAALAAENFVLSLKDQGFDSCMMEGFDECRVKKIIGLRRSGRVVMVIGIGKAKPNGIWGERFRLPLNEVVHEI